MINLAVLVFNSFQENTYIVSDATGECIIVDPGNSTPREDGVLSDYDITYIGAAFGEDNNQYINFYHVLENLIEWRKRNGLQRLRKTEPQGSDGDF